MKCPKCGSENLEPVLGDPKEIPGMEGQWEVLRVKDGKLLDRCNDCGHEFTEGK